MKTTPQAPPAKQYPLTLEALNQFEKSPQLRLLKKGTPMYRFTADNPAPSSEGLWVTADTFQQLQQEATEKQLPITQLVLSYTAMEQQMTPPSHICQLQLVEDYYVLTGSVKTEGGEPALPQTTQIWLPELASYDCKVERLC